MKPLSPHTLSSAPKWRDNPNKYPARAIGNTETGRHMGFPKKWCPAVMPEKSFYTVWLNPSYDTA